MVQAVQQGPPRFQQCKTIFVLPTYVAPPYRLLRLHNTRLFLDPRLLLFVLQNIVGYKYHMKCGLMSDSMKWRHLGHLQLLSRAVVVMAEMKVSPQSEMANPQGMKVFAVERHGLHEHFVYSPALCGVQSSPLVFVPNRPIVWGPLPW